MKIKPNKAPLGTERIKRKFALLPIWDGKQYIWLETVILHQRLERRFDVTCGADWTEWITFKVETTQ